MFTEEIIEPANMIRLISNTPAFLYSKLREVNGILDVSRKFETQVFLDAFASLSREPNRMEKITDAYLILCALSLKSDFDISVLRDYDTSWIRWSDKILGYMSEGSRKTQFLEEQLSGTIPQASTSDTTALVEIEGSANESVVNNFM